MRTRRSCSVSRTTVSSPETKSTGDRRTSVPASARVLSSSRDRASFTEWCPLASLRRALKCPSVPSRTARSLSNTRMYVPTVHSTTKFHSSFEVDGQTSKREIVISLGARSISIPSRAISYRRFPPTLMAETIGGICCCVPSIEVAHACTISSESCGTAALPVTSPSASSESVALPSFTTPV